MGFESKISNGSLECEEVILRLSAWLWILHFRNRHAEQDGPQGIFILIAYAVQNNSFAVVETHSKLPVLPLNKAAIDLLWHLKSISPWLCHILHKVVSVLQRGIWEPRDSSEGEYHSCRYLIPEAFEWHARAPEWCSRVESDADFGGKVVHIIDCIPSCRILKTDEVPLFS